MSAIFRPYLSEALTYPEYRELIDKCLAEGKTTGEGHPESYVDYTRLNVTRMERIEKTVALNEDLLAVLKNLKRRYIWLVITEGWCGDAAQNLPVLHLMEQQTPNIEMKLVLRDENPELMDRYLTNGGRSIPKLIALDAKTEAEIGIWGPRPVGAQELLKAYKANDSMSHEEFAKQVQLWYAKDGALSVQREMMALLLLWESQAA